MEGLFCRVNMFGGEDKKWAVSDMMFKWRLKSRSHIPIVVRISWHGWVRFVSGGGRLQNFLSVVIGNLNNIHEYCIVCLAPVFGRMIITHFDKSKEQRQACLNYAMARNGA